MNIATKANWIKKFLKIKNLTFPDIDHVVTIGAKSLDDIHSFMDANINKFRKTKKDFSDFFYNGRVFVHYLIKYKRKMNMWVITTT